MLKPKHKNITFSVGNGMKVKLIANPVAGGDARSKIDRAVAWLRDSGAVVDLFLTEKRGDALQAARIAKGSGYDRIIAAGGDGTLNEVINGLVPSALPLAFIPFGTTNVFALEVGIPFDVEQACAVALRGQPRPVCLGMAGDTRFLLMAGIGFDAEVVAGVSLTLKRRVGKLAYLVSSLAVLLRSGLDTVEVVDEQGRHYQGSSAIIGNGRYYGGRFFITPAASLQEDTFEVCLFRSRGRLGFLRSMIKVAFGRPLSEMEVWRFKARELAFAGSKAAVQLDGDYHGRLPMTFRAAFGELTLVYPKG
jgi:YegS/Rv2252/BmrU family lipid kinase